jgi:hypothetical protein
MSPTVNLPLAGHYKMKLVKGGPWVPVRIWCGPSHDPVTGEVLDRSWLWQAQVDGGPFEDAFHRAWPYCAGHPITDTEYNYMRDVTLWAKEYAPEQPEAAPRQRIDLNRMPTLF